MFALGYLVSVVCLAQGPSAGDTSFWHGDSRDGTWQVRHVSGLTVHTEALQQDGQWVGRHWAADGTFKVAYEGFSVPSFVVELDGKAVSNSWKRGKIRQSHDGPMGFLETRVELVHRERPLSVTVCTRLDGTAILTRWLEIENRSDDAVALTRVVPWSSFFLGHEHYWGETQLPKRFEHAFSLGYFTKTHHCWEGWFEWVPLVEGKPVRAGCRLGQCFDDPFFVLRNNARGLHYIGHLEWAANWEMAWDYSCPGAHHLLSFTIGPTADAALRVIASGETIRSPALHLGPVAGDLDAAVQTMHDHVRGTVFPDLASHRAYRIQYALPGDQGYLSRNMGDHSGYTEESVKRNVDIAAAIGAELFIMDAGWWDHQGDWRPSKSRFPNGLDPIVDYVREKNMLFGLYCEVEKASPASSVGKAHPDWINWYTGFPLLNFADPEVESHVESEIRRMVREYRLDLFRLDWNVPSDDPREGKPFKRHGIEEANFWRYYEAFARIFTNIRREFPDLILQQAAGGGGRNDFATVGQFHEQYLTDGLRMPIQIQNYAGQTLSLPPGNFIIAHGADAGGGFASAENLHTNLRVSFALSTPWLFAGTVAPSLDEFAPGRLELYRHYVDLYKDFIRPLLPTCKTYHHAPVSARGGVETGGFFAMEFAAPNRSRGWAMVSRIAPSESDTYLFKPRGLDRGRRYVVTFDSTGERIVMDGLSLSRDGIPIRLETLNMSELLLFVGDGVGSR